jgi:hypothetical protein
MLAPSREQCWPERARGGRHSFQPLLAARPSGFAGREVLGVSVMGRWRIGPSGAVSNQGPVLNLTRRRYGRCRLLPAMAFAFGRALVAALSGRAPLA